MQLHNGENYEIIDSALNYGLALTAAWMLEAFTICT